MTSRKSTTPMHIAVVFFVVYFVTDVESQSRLVLDDVRGILTLLQLKEQECDYAVWCSLNGTGEAYPSRFATQCCSPCSCRADCARSATCCPDYQLSKYLDGVVYNTVYDLSRALKDMALRGGDGTGITVSPDDADEDDNVGSDTDTDTDPPTECVQLQVLSDTPFRPAGIAYRVITKCTSTQADPAFKPLCEDFANSNHGVSLALRLTPVQSSSNNVYRNVFCYRCSAEKASEQAAHFSSWTARLVTSVAWKTYFTIFTYNTVDEVFESVLTKKGADVTGVYNIIFEPPAGGQPLNAAGRCHVVDVNTCDNVTAHTRDHVDACEGYFAPVYVYSSGAFTTLNNLACLKCNSDLEQETICRGNTRRVKHISSMRIAKQAYMAVEGTRASFLDTVFDKEGKCKTGYAHDTTKDRCRKVYCPNGYIIANKGCVPLFDDIRGLYYEVYLSVTSRAPSGEPYQWSDVYQLITEHQANGTTDGITIHDFSVWKAISDDTNIVAHIVFTTIGPAADLVKWNLLKEPIFSSTDNRVPFAITLLSIKGSLIEPLSDTVYIKPYPEAKYFEMSNVTTLTSDDFCFRIQADRDEVKRSGKSTLIETAKRPLLYSTPSVLYKDANGLPLTCAENIITLPKENLFYAGVSGVVKVTSVFDGEEDVSFVTKGTALAIFLGSTIFLLVAVYVLRHKCIYRSSPSNRHRAGIQGLHKHTLKTKMKRNVKNNMKFIMIIFVTSDYYCNMLTLQNAPIWAFCNASMFHLEVICP